MNGCVICGCANRYGVFSRISKNRLKRFLVSSCRVTSFMYGVLMSMVVLKSKLVVCYGCMCWLRSNEYREQRDVLLPLDAFFKVCVDPVNIMNSKLFKRLYQAALSDNIYHGFFPLAVVSVIGLTNGNIANIPFAWWVYNGRPLIFHHRGLAKSLRKIVYGGRDCVGLDFSDTTGGSNCGVAPENAGNSGVTDP